jgi:hypothetical protein
MTAAAAAGSNGGTSSNSVALCVTDGEDGRGYRRPRLEQMGASAAVGAAQCREQVQQQRWHCCTVRFWAGGAAFCRGWHSQA